ncbi:glycerophosphocholine phosphodiesterase GPCPD1 isoform X2 [Folsomia candida]|uniref:glycerophosphocholine phosphodiesterase GPCPD1 isoform X2 n=1 Tax=Folsomia candida TaxID=158441 RepID=UPI000B905DB7|nr:glycerophosphocholine phosphodiesterase GPCPD1 isoform X2 [Folsomia candida]
MWEIQFRVGCFASPGESVGVVGNCAELGDWQPNSALLLLRAHEFESPENPEVWAGTILIPKTIKEVQFRYFVCMSLDDLMGIHEKVIVMRRWETTQVPRRIKQQHAAKDGVDTFGVFGPEDRAVKIEHGWLTYESVVQFKIYDSPIQFWRKKYKNAPIRMKMVAVNLNRQNSASDYNDSMEYQDSSSGIDICHVGWPIIEVAVINEDSYQLRLQEQFGTVFDPRYMMVFQAQVLQLHTVAYMIDFYVDGDGDIPKSIGFCHILPSNLKAIGQMCVPITSLRQEPIGQINVDYLVVKPMPTCACDMRVSYSRYWKNQWKGLDIGHRGAGNSVRSFQSCANIRENTIASLQKAAEHGADFVEFDVQLSKDFVPVLFHDFHVSIGLQQKAKKGGELTSLRIPVKDLTLKQLHELKVSHVNEIHTDEDEDDAHDPFPTLKHALEILPDHVGFNVEVKWTMETKDGNWELENPFELNMYLDIVLKIVLEYGGERRIVFSCFHPDICTMIRLKQNKYPVLFLTQGVTSKYPEYKDARTKNISVAVYYALHAGILGLNVHTEDILRDPSQIKEIVEHGLIAFCWGDDNNNAATIRYLKELGLHGVIYDRITDHIPHTEKKSIFFTEHQDELLQIAVMSPEAEISPDVIIHHQVPPEDTDSDETPPSTLPDSPTFKNDDLAQFIESEVNGPNAVL